MPAWPPARRRRDGAIVWAHADRPVAHHRRILDHVVFHQCTARPRHDRHARHRPDRARAHRRSARRARTSSIACSFEDLGDRAHASASRVDGHLRTAPAAGRPVRIAWTADVCGQGWGIDTSRGGMRLFETMARRQSRSLRPRRRHDLRGRPLREEVKLDDGTMWRNIVTPAKSKVAETLDEYRGNHLYNRLDEHYRRFAVAGRPGRDVGRPRSPRQLVSRAGAAGDSRRTPRNASRSWRARARQAFLEHYPVTMARGADARSIARSRPDRSSKCSRSTCAVYRGANNENLQPAARAPTPRSSAARQVALARRRAGAIDGDLEDRRRRHAAGRRRGASAGPP